MVRRPISLLSIFTKLFEKLLHKRLYSFAEKNTILYQYQFGYRKNYSTSLALIDVVDSIIKHLDVSDITVGIYLDLQKASDTVNHEILLAKMKNYGNRGVIIGLLGICITEENILLLVITVSSK